MAYATVYGDEWAVLPEEEPHREEAPIREYWRELVERRTRKGSYVTQLGNIDDYDISFVFDSKPVSELRELYEFRNGTAVNDYLKKNPTLPALLENAHNEIQEHFGPDVSPILDLVKGHEADDDERLFVFVQTTLSPDEALDRLDELYEKWWLDALSTVRPKLSIDVEYI